MWILAGWKYQNSLQVGKTPEDVKSIAVDFTGYTLLQREYIRIYVTMNAPVDKQFQGKIAVNTFYYTFNEFDGTPKSGESNGINTTIFSPIATIGDTLFFDKNNNSIFEPELGETRIVNTRVELYIEVDEEDDYTIIYNGYILKLVNTTTTSSAGNYTFTTDLSGVYFVRFINPNPSIYGAFSKKMENYNESIQVSQVDQNGFTDPIIIDFEANDNKDINYLFADAGLIPTFGEYNFKKESDVPQGEYVDLGSDVTFSIYDVENKSSDFELENFVLEDIPHKALAFKSISIPAYENAENVKYTVKYKLSSSDDIRIVPFGENLSANIANRIDFLVSVQPGDHVDKIFIEFGTVPAGFRAIDSTPIIIEFTVSNDINEFDDIPDDQTHKIADNVAQLKFMVNDTEITYEDDDNIAVPVPEENKFKKVSNVPEGEYVELGSTTTFSIYDVANKTGKYTLTNFILEDIPHKGLNLNSISIPAYEEADNVVYSVKYKTASGSTMQVIPFAENLKANESHNIIFIEPLQQGDYVDRIRVEFGTVPIGFKTVNDDPIIIEFTVSQDINEFDDITDDPKHKKADNIAQLKYMANDTEVIYEDDDDITIPVPQEEKIRKESNVPKGQYVIVGHNTTFSIYGVENQNSNYSLEKFTLEDVPHRGLNFTSISIPAYENAEDVKYTVKYKLASSDDIQILPGGENLSANESHKVDFTVPIRWYEHVDIIYVEFGTIPVGFKPIDDEPIVIEFRLSRYMEDFDYLLGSTDKIADNTAYLKYILNGEEVTLEDNDYVLVKEKCGKPCIRKPCTRKPCIKKKS